MKFEMFRSDHAPVLNATVEQYVEPSSGMRHVHVAREDEESAFLVGFPTVPTASDGRAHILEHLALCGSRKYPVPNPFFAMIRRSTATFMNAMTYADRTVYPFASTNRQDYFNLLDIYLDAVFFPKLDYLSFRQEGWRHVLKGETLAYDGVVFNEMKGTLSDPARALSRGINKILFEGTTYQQDSGGDPLDIPNLTHEMLKEFHAAHYHPSQAMFLTSGRVTAAEVQEKICMRVPRGLSLRPPRMPQLAAAWSAHRETEILVPSQHAQEDEFGMQIAWRMGEVRDQRALYRSYLLTQGLLGDASAPVMKTMQSMGFGRPSRLIGADTSTRQIVIHLGMEGLTDSQVAIARSRIQGTLERVAIEGIPEGIMQSALRDLRFEQREISGGRMPDGLSRLLNAVPMLMYGGDVLGSFDDNALLDELATEVTRPGFFNELVQEMLDTPTCLLARVVPDASFFAKRDILESERLAREAATLNEDECKRIRREALELDALQSREANTEVLPRIRPADVGQEIRDVPSVRQSAERCFYVSVASNRIAYANVFFDVSHFPKEEWPWLGLYADFLPSLGVGQMTYEEASAWRKRRLSGFGVSFESLGREGAQSLTTRIAVAASCLQEEQSSVAEVVAAWVRDARFDELERIAYLVTSRVRRKLATIAQFAGQYASLIATAPICPSRRFESIVSGPAGLPFHGELQSLLEQPDGAKQIADRLRQVHDKVVRSPQTVLCAGNEEDAFTMSLSLMQTQQASGPDAVAEPQDFISQSPANAVFVVSSQVNNCVQAWVAPGMVHPDSAPLAVAAELMSNRILHQSLREKGGAYGGSASYSEVDGVFAMSTVRDPRLAGTYADFERALHETVASDFGTEALEEAIVCVIKRFDKPRSPHAASMDAWNFAERGVTPELRRKYRVRVLGCSLDQVRNAVQHWLVEGARSRAAAIGNAQQDLAGLEILDIQAPMR